MLTSFLASLRGQQRQTDERAERAVVFGGFPDRANFVVIENTGARAFFRVGAPHAFDNRRHEVVMPGREPIENTAHDGEHGVGLPRTMLVLDVVEQRGDVGAFDVEDVAISPARKNMRLEQPRDFAFPSAGLSPAHGAAAIARRYLRSCFGRGTTRTRAIRRERAR